MATKSKARRPTITLIGAGNVAQSLGPALRKAGYRILSVAFRNTAESKKRATSLARKLGARTVALQEASPDSDVIWICHTDDALAATAHQLARKRAWKGKIVFHSSGALTSDVLSPLRRAGAHTASLHPMMTFVPGVVRPMEGVPFAVEGDEKAAAAARRIVGRMGAETFSIARKSKVLYHALGSFSSPLIVATLTTAERVAVASGLTREQARKIIGPILAQTLENYRERGAAAAFSGPVKRGDIETIRRHLTALERVPAAADVYRALVKSAVRDLPVARKDRLVGLLDKNR